MQVKYDQPITIKNCYKSTLGQRPIWDWRIEKFYWIDIFHKLLIENNQSFSDEKIIPIDEGITNILLNDTSSFIFTTKNSLFNLDISLNQKRLLKQFNLENENVINDSSIDRESNIWISTMNKRQISANAQVIKYNKELQEIQKDNSYIVSNGPIFDYERNIGYVTDSIKRIIYRFSTKKTFDIENKQVFLSLSLTDGNPDGMTIDKNGNIWIAMWGSGKVCCFDSEGKLKIILQLPVSKVTSCTFGGSDLSKLFITTASVGLSDIEYERQPNAGKIFVFQTQEEGYGSNCFQPNLSNEIFN